jgi:outer membrane protein assembly factor BamB
MKPTKILLLSGLLLALCLSSLFALWRRANRIHSEEARSPHIRWSYTPGSSPLSGIALASNGTIHFAAADGIYALSPEGQLLGKAPLPFGPVVAAPALAPSGTLYAASQSGKLFALDTSGNLIWQSVSTQHTFFTPPTFGDCDALYVTDDFPICLLLP